MIYNCSSQLNKVDDDQFQITTDNDNNDKATSALNTADKTYDSSSFSNDYDDSNEQKPTQSLMEEKEDLVDIRSNKISNDVSHQV